MAVAKTFVYDKKGRPHTIPKVSKMLGVSTTWVVNHRHEYLTVEALEIASQKIITRAKRGPSRVALKDIPVGSWESKHVPCPAAETKTAKEILKNIWHEQDFLQRDQYIAKDLAKQKGRRENGRSESKISRN